MPDKAAAMDKDAPLPEESPAAEAAATQQER